VIPAFIILLLLAVVEPPLDRAGVRTLEDIYGPSAESFQAAVGFRVLEGNTTNGAARTSFGASLDDMVLEWREFALAGDAAECSTSGSCATVEASSGKLYEGNGVLEITVTDPSPYRCTGGSRCTPEAKNDCDHNGSFADVLDDNDCDDDGTTDVLARGFQTSLTPDSEWAVLNRVGATDSYRGSLPYSAVADAQGVLLVVYRLVSSVRYVLGGAYSFSSSFFGSVTVQYEDAWDGSSAGSPCQNEVDPAQRGVVQTTVDIFPRTPGNVVVRSFRLDDTAGDGDGFPDTGETVDLYLTLLNKTGKDLTHVVVTAATGDAKVECLLRALVSLASFPADAAMEVPAPLTFRVSPAADRAGIVPPVSCTSGVCSNGAGSCTTPAQCQKTVNDDYSATFTIAISADQFDASQTAQKIVLDLDLDSASPAVPTSTFVEGFETGFGNFQLQNLDVRIASNSASNGYRCQYSDPDFISSNSYGDTECYLGFIAGQNPNNHWHSHSTANPDGGRAYLGTRALHYGVHTPGDPGLDTTGLSQLDAIRSKSAIHLAARTCRDDSSADKRSCNTAADCAVVGGGPCVAASAELSFKHQVSTADNRHTGTPDGHTVDRCVVAARLASGTIWQKLYPYLNVYDAQGTEYFSNCMFDPVDDGNTEDDYFDPTDPARRLGPSSTCYPEFAFSYLGDTRYNVPFAVQNVGRASDGPGLQGSLGNGTWVESRFDLTRYRGRSILIRYLFTSIKVSDTATLQAAFMWNPIADDDGWYVDDVRVTQTLGTASPTVVADTASNAALPGCGPICGSLTAGLVAVPSSLPLPGRSVTLSASASADRCAGGVLLYQFWLDGNGDGMLGDPSDVLLRDYGIDPIFEDAPLLSTSYIVRVKCSTAAGPPCDGVLGAASVSVSCPLIPFDGTFDAVAWWTNLTFTGKETFAVPDPGFHPRLDVARGDLGALRSTGAFGGETCIAGETYATTFTDASIPVQGSGYYYLVRDADPVCNDNASWSTYHPRELEDAAPGRRRDGQIEACGP